MMKDLIISKRNVIEKAVFNNTSLEKLTIENSTVALPSEIGLLTNLKELKLVDNTITSLPKELFNLDKTFIFFENNKPAPMQEASLLFFDFQWGKITKEQAVIYLFLLQNQTDIITKEDINTILQSLDYRIESVRKNAEKVLNKWLPITNIKENSVVTFLGQFDVLSLNDIAHRLDNLSIKYQTKITAKTTHVVLCNEPKVNTLKLDFETTIITTEDNFLNWLNKADIQYLTSNNDENEDALENVSEMLLSGNDENIELAIQMMKTHGVSKRLLGDLFIFFNRSSKDQKYFRKAKNLFKKNAPEELLTFLKEKGERHYNTYEIPYWHDDFYSFLKKTDFMDRMQIALALCKEKYYKMSKELKQEKKALLTLIENEILDISQLGKIPEKLIEIKGFSTLICRAIYGNVIKEFPSWFSDLPIQRLDLYEQTLKLPESFRNFKSLTHLCLPTNLEEFPKVITQIATLEVLEMSMKQFELVPKEMKALGNLRKVMVYKEWDDNFDEIKEKKLAFFPTNCSITKKDRE